MLSVSVIIECGAVDFDRLHTTSTSAEESLPNAVRVRVSDLLELDQECSACELPLYTSEVMQQEVLP
jgi:hypothetical protein